MRKTQWKTRTASITLVMLSLSTLFASPRGLASTVSTKARALYQAGLQSKQEHQTAAALRDFEQAARLAPDWEAPVYQEGVLLAVGTFSQAVPVLLKAAKLNPTDDTVWNILGWGYYVNKDYGNAEHAFQTQLQIRANSPDAAWGLANCYGNSQVRAFVKARYYLKLAEASPQFHAKAAAVLAKLPPDRVDASQNPTAPVSIQDAIGMLLSYRSDVDLSARTTVHGDDGQAAAPELQPYVTWAVQHHILDGVSIPSFNAPATRMLLAKLVAKYYGLNAYDYIRPFALTDMSGVSADDQMTVNSMLATRIFTLPKPDQFVPDGTMSRSDYAALLIQANRIMNTPPSPSGLLTPPAPPAVPHPVVYFFTTSIPDVSVQTSDVSAHAQTLTDLGFTTFPFIQDARSAAAATIAAKAGTSYLVPTMAPGSAGASVLSTAVTAGVHPFMVLGNYNQNTNQADPGTVHKILSSQTDSAALAAEAVRLAAADRFSGITVDFENLWPEDRQNYDRFMADLRAALANSPSIQLMVCLPERDKDDPTSPYDYAGLAKNADLAMLITYDEHSAGSKPGPISQLPNDDRVVKYALTQMPAAKILLGVADYGYDWPSTGNGSEIGMANAAALAERVHANVRIDPLSQTPYFAYQDSQGETHTVWFTDSQSVAAELALVPQYGLGGIAVWHLGQDDSGFWSAIQSTFQ